MTYLLAVVAAYLHRHDPRSRLVWKVRERVDPGSGGSGRNLWILGLEMGKGALAALTGLFLAGWTGASLAAMAVVFGEILPFGYGTTAGQRAGYGGGGPFDPQSPVDIYRCPLSIFSALLITRYPPISTLCAVVGVLLLGLVLSVDLSIWLVIGCLAGFVLLRLRSMQ